MAKRILSAVLIGLALLVVSPLRAQDEAKITQLEARRAKIVENIEAAEQLLANNQAPDRAAVEAQLAKYRQTLAEVDGQLAQLKGEPAAGAPATAAAPEISPETQKEIARLQKEIQALITRTQNRAEEIKKERANPTQPQPGVGPGAVDPGAPMPPEMPPVEPGMAPPGMEPGMDPAMGGPAAVPATRLGRLEQQQREDLDRILELQKQIQDLRSGPKYVDPLADDNRPELHPLVLFGGKLDQNPYQATPGPWGSGTVEVSEYGIREGMDSLLVYTDGYYRGIRLDFPTEPEIKTYFDDAKRSYLQMDIVFFPKEEATPAGGEPGMGPGMEPGMEGMPPEVLPDDPGMMGAPAVPEAMPPEAMPGMAPPPGELPPGFEPGMEPGMDPGMMPGGPGMEQPGMGLPQVKQPPATRALRVVLDTDQGPAVVEDFYFDYTYEHHPGWTRVFIPIEQFQVINERTPEKLSRLRLFGDTQDAFYLGMVRFVDDQVPIQPMILSRQPINAVAGEELTLEAAAEAGLSVVSYEWDWGDGDVEETDEGTAKHLYVKPGEYTVKVTAKDVDGLKEPGTIELPITVKAFADVPRQPQPGGMMR